MGLPRTKREATRLSVRRYFTGKICKHGHIAERYTSGGHCVMCHAAKQAKLYENNKESIKAYHREWYRRSGWYEKNKVELKIKRIMRELT